MAGNVVIGQSGGPTAVINQSLVGVVETLRGQKGIGRIWGACNAVRGMIEDRFIDMTGISQATLDRVAVTASAALGSSRDKPDAVYCEKIFDVLLKKDVRYFFYIGGNDSSDTCRIINDLAKQHGYDLRCFHVPKTIDNDLMHSDHTPGYGSAAKFVAQAFMGDNLDNRALAGVKINVVMGRHAGFLTAASVMGRRDESDGPHLVYVPEVAFDEQKFLGRVDQVYKQYGRCLIAVSEGIHDENNMPMAIRLAAGQGHHVERDAHGNIQLSGTGALGDFLSHLVKTKLKIHRVRADTFGYMQRSFVGCTSSVDAAEARAVGAAAARRAMAGDLDGSLTIKRVSDKPYEVAYPRVELGDVAGKTRTLDLRHIVEDCGIAQSFRDYLKPLIGELPMIETL